MRIAFRPAALAIATIVVAAACTSGASPTPAPTEAPTQAPATQAPATPAPTEAPSATPAPTDGMPSFSPLACTPDTLQTLTAGTLTIGTDNPAYPPYFEPSDPNPAPWELGDPTNGKGFESAVAYAVADKLGFTPDKVAWIYVPFANTYAPGAKDFDFAINQVSYKPERAETADLSRGYYFVSQAIVAPKDSPLAGVTTIPGLKPFQFGAMVGTTSYDAIGNVIAPDKEAMVYDTNDAAIEALKNKQIDGLVVDLPTAFFITAVQYSDGVIVGQLPQPQGEGEFFSLVLGKGSPLTPCVDQAILQMRADGTLDQITQTWMADKANAPVFQP
jgi:polar amino acid transport system substrate-binding protein